MVDISVVQRILNSLQESLKHLKSKQAVSLEEYRKNKDLQAIVERRLETAIQACIDIGNHIVAQENFGSPTDYGEIFLLLAQNGLISGEQADALVKMAGFRNVLIHEYRDILLEKVYDILQNKLGDFYDFARSILDYLDKMK